METLQKQTSGSGEVQLTFFQEASPAKTSAASEKEKELPEKKADYGASSIEPLKKYILHTSSLKTHLNSLEKASRKSYMTFPKAGMMRNGNVFALPTLDISTSGNGRSYLPTPLHKDGRGYYTVSKETALKKLKRGGVHWICKAILFYNLNKAVANPQFSRWLMGFPQGWT